MSPQIVRGHKNAFCYTNWESIFLIKFRWNCCLMSTLEFRVFFFFSNRAHHFNCSMWVIYGRHSCCCYPFIMWHSKIYKIQIKRIENKWDAIAFVYCCSCTVNDLSRSWPFFEFLILWFTAYTTRKCIQIVTKNHFSVVTKIIRIHEFGISRFSSCMNLSVLFLFSGNSLTTKTSTCWTIKGIWYMSPIWFRWLCVPHLISFLS